MLLLTIQYGNELLNHKITIIRIDNNFLPNWQSSVSFALVHIIGHYVPSKPKVSNLAFPLINGYRIIGFFLEFQLLIVRYKPYILCYHKIYQLYLKLPENDLSPFVSTKIFLAARSLWITFFEAKNAIPFAI